ncbi:MAG: helix-turn-helix transcriptional regulator [Ruminococcaceae bacterium]|nr:helix-turn-helix transcriptional regulator [Oscillospiraceae bacterium]
MKEPYDFGEILTKQRKLKNMTQKQLAEKLNVSVATISKYESNTAMPPFETVRSLSTIFNISTDVFYGTERRETISTYNLSDEQVKIVQNLTTAFRNHNIAVKKNLSAEQYELLGQIVAEFSKK